MGRPLSEAPLYMFQNYNVRSMKVLLPPLSKATICVVSFRYTVILHRISVISDILNRHKAKLGGGDLGSYCETCSAGQDKRKI